MESLNDEELQWLMAEMREREHFQFDGNVPSEEQSSETVVCSSER